MSQIAFIAPDKNLYLQGKSMIRELGLENQVVIHLARLNRAIRLARKMQNEDVDVIVCRGGTAQLIIESQIRIPVVEIPITGQDLAQVFHMAKKITGLSRPKVAMLAFSNMIYDIDVMSTILGIDLTIYNLNKIEDIQTRIVEVAQAGIDNIVVGGSKTVALAEKSGLKALLIRSSEYSIRSAFLEAQKVALGRKIEKEHAQELKALIDYSLEGIISVDHQKRIKIFNPAAERLLKIPAREALGKKLEVILDFVDINACLDEGQESIGQVAQFGSSWFTYNVAPISVRQSVIGAIISFQDITRIQEMEARIRNEVLTRKFNARYHFNDILGISDVIQESKRIALEIAQVDATVLIEGESGTGKELFAQSMHNQSKRKHGPFVAVNCAALPPSLLESELFGYVEGAFTGATKKGKPGLFEMAHRGTIFLDEISEMDKYGQSRLLRVLQERQVMRLGDDKYIPVDVRIIAATNKNLAEQVREGHFRRDLFYRLKVLVLNLPPLRKRAGDVKFLAQHFLDTFKQRHNRKPELTGCAYQYLSNYSWPGNVRELMHFIERLVIIAKEKEISEEILFKYWEDREDENDFTCLPATQQTQPQTEEGRILEALKEANSNISKAAKILGMDRGTLYRKLKSYNIGVTKSY